MTPKGEKHLIFAPFLPQRSAASSLRSGMVSVRAASFINLLRCTILASPPHYPAAACRLRFAHAPLSHFAFRLRGSQGLCFLDCLRLRHGNPIPQGLIPPPLGIACPGPPCSASLAISAAQSQARSVKRLQVNFPKTIHRSVRAAAPSSLNIPIQPFSHGSKRFLFISS